MSLVKMIDLPKLGDSRGQLVVLEENKEVPFNIKRVYYMYGAQSDIARGFHAHKELDQVAVCVAGKCKILLDDGINKDIVLLTDPARGVSISSMIWHEMHDFSENCVLLVLASDLYDEADYIRNYDEFLREINS